MAHFPPLGVEGDSILSDYSESFELDDSASVNSSLDWSQGKRDVLSELEKTLFESADQGITKGELEKRSHDHVDFNRTVRSPIMMAEHLKENDDANLKRTLSNTVNGGVSNPNTGSATALKRALSSTIGGGGGGGNPRAATTLKRTLSSTVGGGGGGGGSRSTSTAKPTRFKEATRKIQTMKSATKGFKSSDELRDIVYKDWLTEKASLEMEHKQFKVQEKKFQEEKIRKKQVGECSGDICSHCVFFYHRGKILPSQ